jgi:hypothetical protein
VALLGRNEAKLNDVGKNISNLRKEKKREKIELIFRLVFFFSKGDFDQDQNHRIGFGRRNQGRFRCTKEKKKKKISLFLNFFFFFLTFFFRNLLLTSAR